MGNSWKMICTDNNDCSNWTTGKLYEVKDGILICDGGEQFISRKLESYDDFLSETIAEWELITDEPKEVQPPDAINPSHYKDSCSLECIEAMEMAYGKYWVYVYCLMEAWKYIWRYKNKNGEQDIKKARWYVDKAKSLEEGAGECDSIESVLTRIECENLWWQTIPPTNSFR